jgi:3-methyladenine DNA glycosylase AlkD
MGASSQSIKKAPAKAAQSPTAKKPSKAPKTRMTLAQAMATLEQAGSEQTRKIYRRHGAAEPLFGVSFAMLQSLRKAIGLDHELACGLWQTGNYDARNLALKIADPALMSPADLDHWARTGASGSCMNYVATLAVESAHGWDCAKRWLASGNETEAAVGWSTVAALAMNDTSIPDEWFSKRLDDIETTIHDAPNAQRTPMLQAAISIGCRHPQLREAALATAERTGKVLIDHGETSCKTPDLASTIDKAWTHSLAKGFESPAAHERSRESIRLRC